jgi:hypothetical protein
MLNEANNLKTFEVIGPDDCWTSVIAPSGMKAINLANEYSGFKGHSEDGEVKFNKASSFPEERFCQHSHECVISMKVDGIHLWI